ncbi:PAP/OAS1 substrate-binding domain superfamily [Actinidia rufa]|uniref:PAP/OAS1 substrate-binding domain superfamily n=1 Tax=Actinidia rufa TaxID=165716 RepID=A0A7J0GWE8_9ERIC|nr:PAP/OAS1 substrate-binding domain superfamily [Actinidia rufa]
MEEESSSSASTSSLFSARPHMSIYAHSWLLAEHSAQGILSTIQPTMASEHRRKQVINFLQSLIREYFGTKVFPFGSGPLKTYLPDGDIDLTVVCHRNTEEEWATEMCNILQRAEKMHTDFVIKNVEYIRAQVCLLSKFLLPLYDWYCPFFVDAISLFAFSIPAIWKSTEILKKAVYSVPWSMLLLPMLELMW